MRIARVVSIAAVWLIAASILALILLCIPDPPEPTGSTVHVVTPEAVSAGDLRDLYGYRGQDWREFAWEVERLNGWRAWPVLHLGDRVTVPTYDTEE